ncbi:MAG: nucleotide disphospho-sugar-binding domain-containing protein [Pseudomonadota bacterium]
MHPAALPTHYLVATVGTAGDMFPFISIACALRGRGHRVTFLGPEPHRHYAESAGLDYVTLGSREQYRAALAHPDLWHPRKGIAVVMGAGKGSELALADFVAGLPDTSSCVMVAHQLLLPAAALARMPIVGVYLAPGGLRTVHRSMMLGPFKVPRWVPAGVRRWLWRRIDTALIDPHVLPALNTARRARGMAPVRGFIEHMQSVSDLSVTLFPSWYAATEPDWPQPLYRGPFQLYDPDPGQAPSAELTAFLAAGAPPLVFTPGTGNQQAARYFAQALYAVRRLGRRAIFLSGHRGHIPADLPDCVLWQAYLPLRCLLPRVAALVHHGGIGTTAEALRAGVPQLVVALAFDQFDNGARVGALGVGRLLLAQRLRGPTLARALGALLASEAVRQRCRQVAAHFAQGAQVQAETDALCHAIETVAPAAGT